jgi:hypothetical protein
MVYIPENSWYDNLFENILQEIVDIIEKNKQNKFILIFAGGMSSKVLIYCLHKLFPDNLYIDIGSALDFLCRGQSTRDHKYTYTEI